MRTRISDNNEGTPNTLNKDIVTTLIGIIKPNGAATKLYPYNKKPLTSTFFINLNIYFIICPPQ